MSSKEDVGSPPTYTSQVEVKDVLRFVAAEVYNSHNIWAAIEQYNLFVRIDADNDFDWTDKNTIHDISLFFAPNSIINDTKGRVSGKSSQRTHFH